MLVVTEGVVVFDTSASHRSCFSGSQDVFNSMTVQYETQYIIIVLTKSIGLLLFEMIVIHLHVFKTSTTELSVSRSVCFNTLTNVCRLRYHTTS
jgi:hypothetical protein